MTNVFAAEMYKLKYNILFYACLIGIVASAVIGSVTGTTETLVTAFEDNGANFPLFLVIIISTMACDDYEKDTMKNLVSSGNSRAHIYGGKILAAIAVGLIMFIVDGAAVMTIGYMANGLGDGLTVIGAIESLAVQLLLVLVYVLTFFGFASITKSSKYGIMLGVLYVFAAAMVPWFLGNFVFHANLEAFSIDTLVKSIDSLNFSFNMIVNFAIYGGIAVVLNLIGFTRLKKNEV